VSENGKKNENGNDSKTSPKLFEKGGPGGPGRGNLAENEDLKERVKKVINQLLRSKDEKNRAKGVDLYMKYQHFIDPKPLVIEDKKVMDAIRYYMAIPKLGSVEDFWKFCRRCVDCEHFPFDREKTKSSILIEDIDFDRP